MRAWTFLTKRKMWVSQKLKSTPTFRRGLFQAPIRVAMTGKVIVLETAFVCLCRTYETGRQCFQLFLLPRLSSFEKGFHTNSCRFVFR
jgi:hypothetical protein